MSGQAKSLMHPIQELEKRVQALDEAIETEVRIFTDSRCGYF